MIYISAIIKVGLFLQQQKGHVSYELSKLLKLLAFCLRHQGDTLIMEIASASKRLLDCTVQHPR